MTAQEMNKEMKEERKVTILDRGEQITLGTMNYKIVYPIKSIVEIEKEIPEHSLPFMLSNPVRAMSFSFCYALWKWGIKGGKADLSDEKIEELFYDAIAELGNYSVVGKLCISALQKSGTIKKAPKNQGAADENA